VTSSAGLARHEIRFADFNLEFFMDDEAINLAEAKMERMEASLRDEYFRLRQLRKKLLDNLPYTHRRISQLDIELLRHPMTDFLLLWQIYLRAMDVGPRIYQTTGDKERMLRSLRDHHREFC
jgi:hypothetical protein